MKVVVIGGTGLIGSKVVTKLRAQGHEAVPAAPSTGVNTLTGEGLAEVLQGASVVVDVSNSPSFEEKAVMEFFQTSTGNMLRCEAAAGVGHHVALSIVGTERLPNIPYMRAKIVQEKLIKESSLPHSIVHATQFFEFVKAIADSATVGNTVRLPPVLFQPIASEDVANAVARVAAGAPLNGTVETAGPDRFRFDELIRQALRARNDPREVITDPRAGYYGGEVTEFSLVPIGEAQLGEIRFEDWLKPEGGSLYVDTSGRAWIGPSSGGLLWIRGAERRQATTPGMDGDVIYSISGGPGELWVGRRLGGVTQLREEAGVLHPRTYTERDGLAPGVVYAVNRSRDGSGWAGTLSGAVSHIEKDRITTFTTADGLSADVTIQETPDGVIWAGTAGGLVALRNGNWRRYGGEDGLPPGRVNSLALDGDAVLWIGSSSGLFYWSGTRFESARNAPDLLQGGIYGLAADDVGNLWATTDRRVVSVSRASLLGQSKRPAAVREFSTADGLPSTRGIRRDRSVVKDPSGRIWFSLQGGICVVNPSLPSALAPALVKMESVSVDGLPLGTGPVAHYPSDRHRVVFSFIGVSLAVPGRVRYRYLLDGYDSDWSQPTESREAAYTSLPPARYTFRVMASNSEGLWNGTPASVLLEVEPQLSETWWFRTTALCLTAAAIFAGYRSDDDSPTPGEFAAS
jgi:uncharacterized protein YbjT (DUF2867 family)